MNFRKLLFLFVLLPVLSAAAFARPIQIKVGSPTPKGSPWDKALKQLAVEWNDISDGQVQMRIFSGGVAGEEADVIRKMRFNSLQAAVLTPYGLNVIYPDTFVLSLPFLIHSDDEFNFILKNVGDDLKADLEKQGFKVVAWTNIGWIYMFSRDKVVYPDDMRKEKLATTDSDKAIEQALKAINFNAIPVGLNEVLSSLNSGMIDACYTVRVGAAAYQWFGIANHMLDLPMSPVLAGIVVSSRTWNMIPDRYKQAMLDAADGVAQSLASETGKLEDQAMKIMLENGLVVHSVPEDAKEQWRNEFERATEMIKGDTFSEKLYDRVKHLLEEYRTEHGTE